ncbi:MAG TPA: Ig-like domain-containing protein, partial [Acidimicrobiia bacterium]|nr:Ig-like domain-containing protein [Acidimicrobiia bacterium]
DGRLLRVTFGPAPQVAPVAQNQTVNTNVGAAKTITLVATDINNDPLIYSVVPPGPTNGTLTGTGADRTYTPAAGFSGVDSFTFTANDGTADSNIATVTINVVNRAPTVINPGNLGPHGEGDVVSVAMFGTDPDPSGTPPGTLTWSATGLPTGLSINPSTGQITGTVGIGATSSSPYGVTVKATDAGTPPRSHQVSFNWTIVNTNRSPVLAAIGNKTVAQGSLLAFKATASDPNGDGLTFSLVNPPAGAAITAGGNFTWTPNVSPGIYPVTVKVTDNGSPILSDQKTFTVTVTAFDPNPDPTNRFIDDNGHIFENAIEWLAAKGITQGCNPPNNDRFCPNDRITRGQMAAFLVRAFNYTDNGGGNLFVDDNGHIFENAIDKLATAGVTVGCNPPMNNRFCPNDFVTRGQMAAFLGRAFNYTDNGGGDWFVDDNGSVFENAIDRLRTAGVTQGCNPPTNDRYCPNDFVTRGQMAAFLKRAFGE